MARAYSLDFRERVVAQVARGMTRQAVADLNLLFLPPYSPDLNPIDLPR